MSALRVPIEVDPGPGVAELFDLEVPFKKPVDLFIGGVGDGRHLFSTIIDFGLQLDDLSETKIDGSENMHITTVDISPPSMARLLVTFSLLWKVVTAFPTDLKGKMDKAYYLAVLHYFYFGMVIPPALHKALVDCISETRDRISPSKPPATPFASTSHLDKPTSKPAKPPIPHLGEFEIAKLGDWTCLDDAPSFFSFNPARLPEILAVLDLWCKPSTWKPHAAQHWMDTSFDFTFGGDATRAQMEKERNGLPGCERAQYDVFGNLKFLVPSEDVILICGSDEWRAAIVRYMKKPTKRDGKLLKDEVAATWLVNPTFINPADPKPDPDDPRPAQAIYNPFAILMELVLKYGFGLPESQVTRLSDYTDNHFDGIAGLMRRFPRRFKIEFILGDAFDVMERIRLGISDRPASFPRSFDHIWLSNCPDYVGGNFLPTTQISLLKILSTSFTTYYNLLNSKAFPLFMKQQETMEHAFLTYLGCTVAQARNLFAASYYKISTSSDLTFMHYALYIPSPLPTPVQRFSKADLIHFIHSSFFRLALPVHNRSSHLPQTIREPLTISSLFRVLTRLHEVGYPGHWLSEALEPLLSDTLVTRARPTPGHTLPLTSLPALATNARVSVAPFLPELLVATSLWAPVLPFQITSRHLLATHDIGWYRLQFQDYSTGSTFTFATAPVLALLFSASPDLGYFRLREIDTTPVRDTFLLSGVRVVQGDKALYDTKKRTLEFQMPRTTVERMIRERWTVSLYDTSIPAVTTRTKVVCTERSIKCLRAYGTVGEDVD